MCRLNNLCEKVTLRHKFNMHNVHFKLNNREIRQETKVCVCEVNNNYLLLWESLTLAITAANEYTALEI